MKERNKRTAFRWRDDGGPLGELTLRGDLKDAWGAAVNGREEHS